MLNDPTPILRSPYKLDSYGPSQYLAIYTDRAIKVYWLVQISSLIVNPNLQQSSYNCTRNWCLRKNSTEMLPRPGTSTSSSYDSPSRPRIAIPASAAFGPRTRRARAVLFGLWTGPSHLIGLTTPRFPSVLGLGVPLLPLLDLGWTFRSPLYSSSLS